MAEASMNEVAHLGLALGVLMLSALIGFVFIMRRHR